MTPGATPRREAVGAAAAAMAGIVLAACGGPHHPTVKSPGPPVGPDIALILGLLHLELKTVAAYEAGIPLLDPASAKDAAQFLRQELSHAGELIGLLKKAKLKPPVPPAGYDLGHPKTASDVLELLHRLEAQQLAAYLHAIPRLSQPPLRATLAAVFANDAQHLSVLRGQLGRSPIPSAFVSGRE